MYMSTLWLSSDTPEEGIRSHYRWLWTTMWLLGFELRISGRAVSALKCWAISPAPCYRLLMECLFSSKDMCIKRGQKQLGSGARLWSQHLGGRGRQISEFKASLVYKVSSRTARAIQRNPVSKNQKPKPKQNKKKFEVPKGALGTWEGGDMGKGMWKSYSLHKSKG